MYSLLSGVVAGSVPNTICTIGLYGINERVIRIVSKEERLKRSIDELVSYCGMSDNNCQQSEDPGFHRLENDFQKLVKKYVMELFDDLCVNPFTDRLTPYAANIDNYTHCISLSQLIVLHRVRLVIDAVDVHVSSMALELEVPPFFSYLYEELEIPGYLMDKGFIEQYAANIKNVYSEIPLASELLKLLYPKKWRSILSSVVKKSESPISNENSKKSKKEDPNVKDLIKQGFKRDVATSLTNLYEGDERMIGLHAKAAKTLGYGLQAHKGLARALFALGEMHQEILFRNLDSYQRWLRLMPGQEFTIDEKHMLSAFLATTGLSVPQDRMHVLGEIASKNEKTGEQQIRDKLIGSILESGPRVNDLDHVLDLYLQYLKRF